MVAQGASAGARDQDGAAGADAGDPAGIEGVAADQGADGADQVGTTLGPVQARTDRRAPAGGQRQAEASQASPSLVSANPCSQFSRARPVIASVTSTPSAPAR